MESTIVVVRSKSDLRLLPRRESILHPFRKPPLAIRVPELPLPEAQAWEQRLENLREQCGCTAGAIALLAFVVGFVVYVLHRNLTMPENLSPGSLWLGAVVFVAGVVLSALGGKFAGLWVADVRFRRIYRELQWRLLEVEKQIANSR